MIVLKDIKGNVIYTSEINVGAKRKLTLMKEDYVTLPFSLSEPINIGIGSYIEINEGLFEVVDIQKPTLNNNTGAHDYQLRLDAYYWKWKNKIFKFTPEVGGQEASWSLTASLEVHLGIFLRNLEALGYTYRGTGFEFSIDATVENKALALTYENTNMIDALSAMAEAAECEWWVTDNIIHFGRCEYGTATDFEIGKNVAEMTRSESKSEYATRLYVFGSTRNIPTDYRPVDETVVVNGVVQRRLMLPEGIPYIDAYEGMSEEEAIEQVVVIEDIYPKTDGEITSVETYESTVENEDGTTTTETFYRFKDNGITFSEEYRIEGEELRVKFESGSLNGMEFGLKFNPNAKDEKLEDGSWNPEAQLFEVVANEDYGRKLPDATLYPKVGDKYILIGWDSTKIADLGLVAKAEQELYEKGLEISKKRMIDPSTYNCKMSSDYMYGLDGDGEQDIAFSRTFSLGDKVNLVNPAFFDNGRQSRIIGMEYMLDYPFDSPVYTVGETSAYSRLGALESKVDALVFKGQTYTGGSGSGSGVYVIGTNDSTSPTDRNVYSALRSEKMFLRKDRVDRTPYSLGIGGTLSVEKGAIIKGTTETDEVIVNQSVHSKDFISGFTGGKGWAIRLMEYLNSAGVTEKRATAEFDDLVVRGTLRVFEFILSQMLGENDNRTFTGMMEVDHYDPETGKVWLDTQDGKLYNTFRKDDIIIVQQYNGMPSEDNDFYIVKQYELIIDEVGVGDISLGEDRLDWVTFRNFASPMEGAQVDIINKGDTFVRIDNLTDPNRKGIIQLMTVGESTPYMDVMYGVKTDPDNALKSRFGNLQGIYNHLFGWLKDFGAYIANLYAVGEFRIAHTGEDVADKIEMVKGAFRTNFSQSYFDMKDEVNYLKNGTFSGEAEGWSLGESGTDFMTVDGVAIYANRNVMTANTRFVGRSVYNDRYMLRVLNSDIRQSNSDIRKFGTHKEYIPMDGSEEEPSYEYKEVTDRAYLVMRLYCAAAGTVEVGFDNGDISEDALPFLSFDVEKRTEEYLVTAEGVWNGEGDFVLRTTGDVYVEFITLADRPVDNLKTTTQTWIEQDAGRIALLGQKIDKVSGSVTDLGVEVNALEEKVELYVQKTDENTASISRIRLDIESINLTVASLQGDTEEAKALAEAAEQAAEAAAEDALAAYLEANDALESANAAWNYADNNASTIKIHSNYISILNGRFDDEGRLVNASGLVTSSEFNSLYSAHYDLEGEVAKKADISTSVQFDPDTGEITSAVTITADNVDINNGVVMVDKDSATIGGFQVSSNSLTNLTAGTSTGASIYISNSAQTRFARLNGGNASTISAEFRNDDGTAVYIQAYGGSENYGLKIIGNQDSKAVHVTGSSYFVTRRSNSEFTYVSGLKVCARNGNSLTASFNNLDPYFPSGTQVDFLILTGALSLPDPSTCRGKIYFIKRRGAGSNKLTVPSCYLADGSYDSSAEWNGDDHSRMFISDGVYWNEFYCK